MHLLPGPSEPPKLEGVKGVIMTQKKNTLKGDYAALVKIE